jgi:hypothetical protein
MRLMIGYDDSRVNTNSLPSFYRSPWCVYYLLFDILVDNTVFYYRGIHEDRDHSLRHTTPWEAYYVVVVVIGEH